MNDYLFVWKYLIVFDLVNKITRYFLLLNIYILDNHVNKGMVNGNHYSSNNDYNHISESTTQQTAFHSSDNEASSDDEYTTVNTPKNHQQPIKIADS